VTTRDVLAAVGRRWYVFLAVLLVFAALAVVFYRDGGSYYTRTTLTFTLPERSTLELNNGSTDTSVIAFAGAVAVSINEGKPVARYSSADAPYYGAGVRQGVMVSLRNDGSQWISSFPSATIDVQIVGQTEEWVADRQAAILADIMSVTRGQQKATTTPATAQITATVAPLSTDIAHITSSRTTQMLALAATVLAALLVAVPTAVGVDRAARGRRIAKHRRVASALRPSPSGGYST